MEDAKDTRSISNKADAEKKADKAEEQAEKEKDMKPTDIARSHGMLLACSGFVGLYSCALVRKRAFQGRKDR